MLYWSILENINKYEWFYSKSFFKIINSTQNIKFVLKWSASTNAYLDVMVSFPQWLLRFYVWNHTITNLFHCSHSFHHLTKSTKGMLFHEVSKAINYFRKKWWIWYTVFFQRRLYYFHYHKSILKYPTDIRKKNSLTLRSFSNNIVINIS